MNPHLIRAQLLIEQERYELAEHELRQLLIEDSSSTPGHALLAHCLKERKQFDQAVSEAELAIVSDPDASIGHHVLAGILLDRNRLPEARRSISEAIRLDPGDASHFAVLAQIEVRANRWDDCLTAALKGLEQDPDNIHCINLRSIALTSLGRREEAAESVHSALQRNPDDPVTHANEGWRLLHVRQPEQAMQHFQEALRLDPTSQFAQAGIVEAMKSRHFLYRWLFSFLLWMNRFTPKVQLMLVLGLMFGQRILVATVNSVPALEPLTPVIVIGYVTFVWMTWSGSALFDLVLLTSRFGRLALSAEKKLQAWLVGGCIFATLATFVLFAVQPGGSFTESRMITPLLFPGLTIPLMTVFQQQDTRRKVAIAWTVGLFLLCATANVRQFLLPWQLAAAFPQCLTQSQIEKLRQRFPSEADWLTVDLDAILSDSGERQEFRRRVEQILVPMSRDASAPGVYSVYGIILSTWLGMGLGMIPQRR